LRGLEAGNNKRTRHSCFRRRGWRVVRGGGGPPLPKRPQKGEIQMGTFRATVPSCGLVIGKRAPWSVGKRLATFGDESKKGWKTFDGLTIRHKNAFGKSPWARRLAFQCINPKLRDHCPDDLEVLPCGRPSLTHPHWDRRTAYPRTKGH